MHLWAAVEYLSYIEIGMVHLCCLELILGGLMFREMEYSNLEWVYNQLWLAGSIFLWLQILLPVIGSTIFALNYIETPGCIPRRASPAIFGFLLCLSWAKSLVCCAVVYNAR